MDAATIVAMVKSGFDGAGELAQAAVLHRVTGSAYDPSTGVTDTGTDYLCRVLFNGAAKDNVVDGVTVLPTDLEAYIEIYNGGVTVTDTVTISPKTWRVVMVSDESAGLGILFKSWLREV